MSSRTKDIHPLFQGLSYFNNLYLNLFDGIDLSSCSVPLTSQLAYHISNKSVSFNYGSFNEYYLNIVNNPSDLSDDQIMQSAQYISSNGLNDPFFRVYPHSKTNFYKTFILRKTIAHTPLLSSFLYDCLKSQGLVKIIGAGVGAAVIFRPPVEAISSEAYESFISSIDANKDHYIDVLEKEVHYYIDSISSLYEENQDLKSQIQHLNRQNYIYTQTTWR